MIGKARFFRSCRTFFFLKDYFFRMCLLRPYCVTATNCNTASFKVTVWRITTISVCVGSPRIFHIIRKYTCSLISAKCVVRSEELKLWYCVSWTEHYASLGLLQINIVHWWNNGVQGNPKYLPINLP